MKHENSNSFRLLVFDWDGTLMDSTASIVACMARSLQDVGFDTPQDEVLRSTIGLGLQVSLDHIWPDGTEQEHQQAIERYRHHWVSTYHLKPILFPGARETIHQLAERGYWLAVATGKGRPGLDHDLENSALGEYFLTTRTVNEAPSKPNPAMLLSIMEELGTAPHETVMIGDTTFDLDMALAANTPSIGVLSGAHRRERLLECRPQACLNDVAELPGWLQDLLRG